MFPVRFSIALTTATLFLAAPARAQLVEPPPASPPPGDLRLPPPPPPPQPDDVRVPNPYIPATSPSAADEHADRPAPEPPSARFGAQGELVLGGGTSVGVSSTKFDSSSASQLSVVFSPNLDYFVLRNFSVGVDINVSYSDDVGYASDGTIVEDKTSSVGLGPRLGWNIPLGASFSWWLTGTLGFESIQTTQTLPDGPATSAPPVTANTQSRSGAYVSAYAPLLFHPSAHFFMGVGPSMFHDFGALQGGGTAGEQRTYFGAGFVVGGYWGGTPEPAAAATAAQPPPPGPDTDTAPSSRPRRFGDQGELVLTNELTLLGGSNQYAGTQASSTSGQLVVGGDYFVLDHVSFGVGFSGSFTNSTSTDATGNLVTDSSTTYGGFLRFGVHIPIAGPVSLYPRASIGISAGSGSETSSASSYSYGVSEPRVSAYVPLLVEVAPHFVAGFGPSVSRDISETTTYGNGQQISNPSTNLGAGFVVGGWL